MQSQNQYPLSWPTGRPRTKSPTYSHFGRREGSTLRKIRADEAERVLLSELGRLGAERVAISTNRHYKKDGALRTDRLPPTDVGVAVYFTLKGQKRVLACDKWDRIADNIYAVAMTIEAQRGIERWGSVTTEQAFDGYAALPEKTQPTCWEILGIGAFPENVPLEGRENVVLDAYRRKARETHPDNPNGSHEKFSAVVAAKDMALQLINQ